MRYGFVIDNKRCIGCHACSTACKSENEVPLGVNRTWVKYTETGRFPDVRRHFQVTRCNHCENPPCVAICPVSAMYQRKDGIVEFDGDRCIGCKACIQACPYDAIYLDPATQTAAKCHFCSHRVDVGLEPACVVVCPEHAIIAGDMDDPASEISRYLGKESVMVRKPEQGTKPKLFYVDGHAPSLIPTAAPAGAPMMWADKSDTGAGDTLMSGGRVASQMVQVGYNAQHNAYWRWPVAAYIVTKDIAAGLIIIVAAAFFFATTPSGPTMLTTLLASLVFLGVTSGFLVFDLAKPRRFLYIVFRPQWRSWLARGAFILMLFSGLVAAYTGLVALQAVGGPIAMPWVHQTLLGVLLPLGFLTSAYTAFLFGQAEGRDLWQHPLLPIQFCVRAVLAGSAMTLVLSPLLQSDGIYLVYTFNVFLISLLIDLALTLFAEFAMPHATDVARVAAHDILRGRYRHFFWTGYVVVGHIMPLALYTTRFSPFGLATMGLTALIGLACMELAFVLAPQRVPNS